MSTLLHLVVCIYFIISDSDITVGSVNVEPVQVTLKPLSPPHAKKIYKRYDIDLQSCVENFDIHKDKIIRTEDSRAMGAKYINELDLGSREECLRMCCETSTCDVFVFEEKSPGSCYLFHCGAPDDFKCKFTRHRNYTSAVLAVSRHLTELEDQIRLTKHEQELSQLRKSELVPAQNTVAPAVVATAAAVTSLPPKEASAQSQVSNSSASRGRACSRYQFECRSSGECIAIYNACDGIPQCADRSDEAPELDCPSPAGTTQLPAMAALPTAGIPRLPPPNQPPLETTQSQRMYPQQKPMPLGVPGTDIQQRYRPPPSAWSQQQQPPPPQNLPQYSGLRADSGHAPARGGKLYGREGEGPGPGSGYNAPGPLQWPGFQQQQQQQQQQQPPPQPIQQQQQQQQQAGYRIPMAQFPVVASREYEDQNSHIFTHKGNGLVADSDSPTGQYSEMPHEYNKYGNAASASGYYDNVPYRQPAQNTWQQQNQPMTHDLSDLPRPQKQPPDGIYSGPPIPPDYYYEDSQEARYHPPPGHEQELVQHAGVPHGERESVADGATPIQMKHQAPPPPHPHHHKSAPPAAPESKPEVPVAEHNGSIEVHVKEPEPKRDTAPTTAKPAAVKASHEQHHVSHHKKHPEPEVSLEETGVVIEPVDGEAGKPSGAILSLSLGLCITVFMVILVACRLRLVRKRLRRGGKSPYAHDADYLVNGMYL